MSKLLDDALSPERRAECALHDAEMGIEPRPFFRVEDACPADVLSPEEIVDPVHALRCGGLL